MARDNRETWKKRIEQWADSGLSAREYAEAIGVNVNTLTHWKWLLGVEVRRRPRVATGPQVPAFVELVVAGQGEAARAAPVPQAAPEFIEVLLAGGLRIRVPSHLDAAALRRVLDAAEGR